MKDTCCNTTCSWLDAFPPLNKTSLLFKHIPLDGARLFVDCWLLTSISLLRYTPLGITAPWISLVAFKSSTDWSIFFVERTASVWYSEFDVGFPFVQVFVRCNSVNWVTFDGARLRPCKSIGLYGGSDPESGGLSGRWEGVEFTDTEPATEAEPFVETWINDSSCPKSRASLSMQPIKSGRPVIQIRSMRDEDL